MVGDIAEFDVETDALYVNVRLEPATMRGPGITINDIFVPLQNRDEAREALHRVLDELDPNKSHEEAIAEAEREGRDEGHDEGWTEGHEKGREEGLDEGFSEGWDEGYGVGKTEAPYDSDAYASGWNDGWAAAKADNETEE